MIKKGTQCSTCKRVQGEMQKVILSVSQDGKYTCPWCNAANPDQKLFLSKQQIDVLNNTLKRVSTSLKAAKKVIKKQRGIMDIQHKCLLLVQEGKAEQALQIYADFFGEKNHDIN